MNARPPIFFADHFAEHVDLGWRVESGVLHFHEKCTGRIGQA